MITDLEVLDETYTHSAARSEAVNHPEDYIVEHCYMSSGKPVDVLLDVDMSIIGDVIDSFGKKISWHGKPLKSRRWRKRSPSKPQKSRRWRKRSPSKPLKSRSWRSRLRGKPQKSGRWRKGSLSMTRRCNA